jgi:16S rRNA (guanine1516-N2)-methyltransferase
MNPTAIVAVAATAAADSSLTACADRLAVELQLPRCALPCANYPYLLVYTAEAEPMRLELRANQPHAPGPVFVDFAKGTLGFRTRHIRRDREPLARAIGLKNSQPLSVLDATAGLGRDAFVLATLGCRMMLIERSPVIAALLRDGLARASLDAATRAVAGRMRLRVGDAAALMDNLTEDEYPDVVYLDPMYPQRGKSALVKKEMRLLRALVGEDLDAPQLLATALRVARRRVVAKRPRLAAALPGAAPSHSLLGKTTRYDRYVGTCAADKR